MKTAAGEVDLHRVRLMSLLNELIREHGQRGAAEVLEVDRKTLWRSMERGELSRHLTEALERVMTAGGGSAAARQRERFAALEKGMRTLEGRVGSLEKEVRGGLGEIRAAVEEAGRGRSGVGRLRELARRVAMLERGGERLGVDPDPVTPERETLSHGDVRPGLVTEEPHLGEEESYGAGMALVAEWRELRSRRGQGTRLEQADCRVRIMELEIAMLGDHGLTLPPETEPLHPSRRAVQ
ncbi:MAG: hypothetical protein OXS35_00865, partial [Dehalococcoidia bacterium]|nr:hypothetical protein [Dehalococcoidia bacterium]